MCYVKHNLTEPQHENECEENMENFQLGLVLFFLVFKQMIQIKKYVEMRTKKSSIPEHEYRFNSRAFFLGTFRMFLTYTTILMGLYKGVSNSIWYLWFGLTIFASVVHMFMDTFISWKFF